MIQNQNVKECIQDDHSQSEEIESGCPGKIKRFLKKHSVFIALITWILFLLILSYVFSGGCFNSDFASAFGGLATGSGIIFAAMTLRQMKKANDSSLSSLRKMQDANDFSVITAFHSRMNDPISWESRGYLFEKFNQDLCSVVKKVFSQDCIKSEQVDIDWILKNVNKDEKKEIEFNTELKKIPSGVGSMSALASIERVLLDFDLIAVPFCEGNKSAHKAAHAWKPVLQSTSMSILTLIAIKTRLRTPKSYKYHYLKLISDLKDIDLRGIALPEKP